MVNPVSDLLLPGAPVIRCPGASSSVTGGASSTGRPVDSRYVMKAVCAVMPSLNASQIPDRCAWNDIQDRGSNQHQVHSFVCGVGLGIHYLNGNREQALGWNGSTTILPSKVGSFLYAFAESQRYVYSYPRVPTKVGSRSLVTYCRRLPSAAYRAGSTTWKALDGSKLEPNMLTVHLLLNTGSI